MGEDTHARDGSNPGTPSSSGPTRSCLSGANSDKRIRTDMRGINIEKGKKKHKVLFMDEVDNKANLAEVKEVRAYKNKAMSCQCSAM
mmetsp:Transcript_81490/g.174583  ORF Transcript_81490/g.174583 Transcript_81490/m.174583 type:complete len:87 (-) Transcript_81490:347-607(-)